MPLSKAYPSFDRPERIADIWVRAWNRRDADRLAALWRTWALPLRGMARLLAALGLSPRLGLGVSTALSSWFTPLVVHVLPFVILVSRHH